MQNSTFTYDAIIVGAGPAGVSCAVWLARLGFAPALVDAADAVGGLCRNNPFEDTWNVSLPGVTGDQVAQNLARSLQMAGVTPFLQWPVRAVLPQDGGGFLVQGQTGKPVLESRFVVLASGVLARGLSGYRPLSDDPGEPWPGVLVGPGQRIASQDFAGQRVAVLGGGDNAFENALFALDRGAQSVKVFARTVRAQQQFVNRLPAGALVNGSCQVDPVLRRVNDSEFDLILVLYGWEPNVGFAQNLNLQRTPRGYVSTQFDTAETSCPGVFAVGEVASRQHPCVVTAMADGVTAAKAIQSRLELSA